MDFINQIPEILNNLQSSVDFYSIVFYIFAALIVGAGFATVLSKKLMHSAVGLLFTFFGIAGLYALLAADFVAVTQVMVYIGGIVTLIIFGVMLTTRIIDMDFKQGSLGNVSVVAGVAISLATCILLSFMFITSEWKETPLAPAPDETVRSIGNLLLTDYLVAFIVIAVLLLLAFIGAALIARRKN